MPTGRTIVKYSFFGFLAAVVGLFLLIQIVHVTHWPIQVCDGEGTLKKLASPSKTMVALDVRENCDPKNPEKSEIEAKIFVADPATQSSRLVFVAPATFRDAQGHEHQVVLQMIWKSEDHLEITYPYEVAPSLPESSFRRENFTVRVTSIRKKMTSNPSLQNEPLPAAELKR